VSLVRDCDPEMYPSGVKFPLSELGEFKMPEPINLGISEKSLGMVANLMPVENDKPSDAVLLLLEQRQQARARKDFSESDHLRDVIRRTWLDCAGQQRRAGAGQIVDHRSRFAGRVGLSSEAYTCTCMQAQVSKPVSETQA